MENPIAIKNLLAGTNIYSIPRYQRNFAWTFDEIGQLVIDVLDSIKSNRDYYYIGTLVVSDKDDEYSIIDGQQRFTALLLICLAIQNHYADSISFNYVNGINLKFAARKHSDNNLFKIFNGEVPDEDEEIASGYNNTISAIKEYVINDEEYVSISIGEFYDYLLNKVMLFISTMPEDLDLNLYFERFNSRGEQLEFHEIIKAELMQKLVTENVTLKEINKFAKIWDACSEFNTPVISFFKKKAKHSDNDNERELIFDNKWEEYSPGNSSWRYRFEFNDLYEKIEVATENRMTLIEAIDSDDMNVLEVDVEESIQVDEIVRYRTIINFNTFLYYVLYITDKTKTNEIQLDDKKLQRSFASSTRDKDWIFRFGMNLLKMKFIFDNLIIRNSLETTDRRTEGDWFLQKAYRIDKNEKRRGHLYVQTRFDKNSFEQCNEEILMIQSMFAVTFTAYKDTRWLYSTLKFLYNNSSKLNDADAGVYFLSFLEKLSIEYANERFAVGNIIDKNKMRYDQSVPVYAFNFVDYVLWRNRAKLKNDFKDVAFNKFIFRYRRSIEHWYPQNRDAEERTDASRKMDDQLLHSFGNL
ncbi:MAG: DUF262 domain-containing protein, partial [Streptococcaceae bacterium]|nr:DUF262 domain-containing protein [Streptococcaceae bacterium]